MSGRGLTLWGLEIFAATAEEGAVSAAARRLGASPSAVSQQLSALEAALGQTLLERSTRPVRLTPAGEVFLGRAQTILDEARQAQAELATVGPVRLSRLRLGVIEDLEADVTPQLLTGLSQSLPDTRLLLETGPSHVLLDQLEARALDMAVASVVSPPAGCEVHPILSEAMVLAAPRGVFADPPTLADLEALPLIHYTTRHIMGRIIADILGANAPAREPRFEFDSYHAILALVAEGGYWTLLPPLALHRARRFADALDLWPLPAPLRPLRRRVALVARKGELGTRPAEAAARLRSAVAARIAEPLAARAPELAGALVVEEAERGS